MLQQVAGIGTFRHKERPAISERNVFGLALFHLQLEIRVNGDEEAIKISKAR
jgi:hypothetical protein